jgi:hypothetical protein
MSKSVSDMLVSDLVGAFSRRLASESIQLSLDQLDKLNSVLSAFLTEDCETLVEIKGDRQHENCIQVAFDVVAGTVTQTVRILDDDYDEESIVEGLDSGVLVTTMGHGEEASSIDVTATGEVIGIIVDQEVDGEYEDFR